MRVLYFDPFGLLYSSSYLNSSDELKELFFKHRKGTQRDFVANTPPDAKTFSKLAEAAEKAGFVLFPIARSVELRPLLLNYFPEAKMAPDIVWNGKLKMGSNMADRLLAHARTLGVDDWYVCGSFPYWELNHLQNRYLKWSPEYINRLFERIRGL